MIADYTVTQQKQIMDGRNSRTERLVGTQALNRIRTAKVAVIGLGGVGSFVAESLARSGVENFILLDSDCVTESNINRQNIALYSTIGKLKTSVLRDRILDINPGANITVYPIFYSKDTACSIDFSGCSYIADAIDNITGKLLLIEDAARLKIPIISAMGAGNKLDPSQFEITDIYKTSVCPLARVMRRELKARGIPSLTVVYSKETPYMPKDRPQQNLAALTVPENNPNNDSVPESLPYVKPVPASISFVPAAAGLLMASHIIKNIAFL